MLHHSLPIDDGLWPPRFRVSQSIVVALVVLSLALACGAGCNKRPRTLAVTGTVTYHGKPVDGARVMFIPKNTRPASGQTDAQGRFKLLSFRPNDGAVLGEHIVCVDKSIPDPNDKKNIPYENVIAVLPERYATPLKSPLKATVTAKGPNDFRFDLTD